MYIGTIRMTNAIPTTTAGKNANAIQAATTKVMNPNIYEENRISAPPDGRNGLTMATEINKSTSAAASIQKTARMAPNKLETAELGTDAAEIIFLSVFVRSVRIQ